MKLGVWVRALSKSKFIFFLKRKRKEMHMLLYMGHQGITSTFVACDELFYWSYMRKDVQKFVSSCLVYQRVKHAHGKSFVDQCLCIFLPSIGKNFLWSPLLVFPTLLHKIIWFGLSWIVSTKWLTLLLAKRHLLAP